MTKEFCGGLHHLYVHPQTEERTEITERGAITEGEIKNALRSMKRGRVP